MGFGWFTIYVADRFLKKKKKMFTEPSGLGNFPIHLEKGQEELWWMAGIGIVNNRNDRISS